jgi:hypothetical protein
LGIQRKNIKEFFMELKELMQFATKLSAQGMTDHLRNGMEAIPVSLFLPMKFGERSRAERKTMLQKEFSNKLSTPLCREGVEVDFDSLSVSGQTVDAKLGIQNINDFSNYLNKHDISIYPNIKQQIV